MRLKDAVVTFQSSQTCAGIARSTREERLLKRDPTTITQNKKDFKKQLTPKLHLALIPMIRRRDVDEREERVARESCERKIHESHVMRGTNV